nr:reverse transcriptase domain-containing protein [Tanacetum cinerariifolium]
MIDQALLQNSTNKDESHSSDEDNRRNVQTACPCFYADFMKCQPLNFKGTEGVVKFATCTLLDASLTWWNGQIRTLGPDAYTMTWEILKRKMTDKSSSRITRDQSSKQKVENSNLEEHLPLVVTMADNRTMAELLRAPTEGDQFFRLEKDNPHDHIRAARRWLEKEPPCSITTWEDLLSNFINKLFPPSRTTSLRNEILNFQQKFDKSFHEAWDRYKDLLHACPHHDFTELHKLNTFYNALNPADQDSLNAAAGGNLLERSTHDVLTIIETNLSVVTTAMTAMLKRFQATPPSAPVKAVEEICVTCGGAHPYYDCLATGGNTFLEFGDNIQGYVSAAAVNYNQAMQTRIDMVKNELRNEMKSSIQTSLSNQTNEIMNMMASLLQMNTASTSSSGTLPSNTVVNPKSNLKAITTRSGVSYDGPSIPPSVVENEPEATKDTVNPTNNGTTEDVQPQTVQSKPVTSEPANTPVSASKPNPKASIPYPSRRNDERNREKYKDQIEKLYQIFKDMTFEISFADALILMPKLPEKLGDPGKFLIPCDFPGMAKCLALADLGASINLMPYSVWKKLSLPELTPTCMTLELVDRSISRPVGVAEDVYVKVGSFHFLADFVVVDFDADPRVPLILGRSFLKTRRDLIYVFKGELTIRVGKEAITFNLDQTSRYSTNYNDMTAKRIDVIDMACEEYSQEVLGFSDTISSGNPTPCYDLIVSVTSPTLTLFENNDFLLEEVVAFLAIEDEPTSSQIPQSYLDPEGDILLLEAFLNDDPSSPPPNKRNCLPEVSKELK